MNKKPEQVPLPEDPQVTDSGGTVETESVIGHTTKGAVREDDVRSLLATLDTSLDAAAARFEDAKRAIDLATQLVARMENTSRMQQGSHNKLVNIADEMDKGRDDLYRKHRDLISKIETAIEQSNETVLHAKAQAEARSAQTRNHLLGYGVLLMAVAAFFLVLSITDIFWYYPAMAMPVLYTISEERFGLNMPPSNIHD